MYPAEGDVLEHKYRVERKLGEGGMGAVFRATHLLRKAPVALKFMAPAMIQIPEAVGRFMNEAVAASEISSDHVVRIHDVCRWGETPYLVMEYLEGHDLAHEIATRVQQGTPSSVGHAVHLVLQILRALQAAHARGIVHRDLKPANVFLVTHDGEPDFVKLVDFGISKRSGDEGVSLTKTNTSMGTPLYMAPEQARNAKDADHRSDLYSVAAILYETLTSRPPLEADTYNMVLYKLFQEEPQPLRAHRPDAPMALESIAKKGLAKEASLRFQTAVEFAASLAPFAEPRSSELLSRILTRAAPPSAQAATPHFPGAAMALSPTLAKTADDISSSKPGSTELVASTAVAFGGAPATAHRAARSNVVPYAIGGALLVVAAISTTLFLSRGGGDDKPAGTNASEPTRDSKTTPGSTPKTYASVPNLDPVIPSPTTATTSKPTATSAAATTPAAATSTIATTPAGKLPKVAILPTSSPIPGSGKAAVTTPPPPPPATKSAPPKPTWGIDQ